MSRLTFAAMADAIGVLLLKCGTRELRRGGVREAEAAEILDRARGAARTLRLLAGREADIRTMIGGGDAGER